MSLTNEHVGPKILAKIKIYVLTRAKLLFHFCYEIPCSTSHKSYILQKNFVSIIQLHLSLLNLVKIILYLPDCHGGMCGTLEAHFNRFLADTR